MNEQYKENLVAGYVDTRENNHLIVVPGTIIMHYSTNPWKIKIDYSPDSLELSIEEIYHEREEIKEAIRIGKTRIFSINPDSIQEFIKRYEILKSKKIIAQFSKKETKLLNDILKSADFEI